MARSSKYHARAKVAGSRRMGTAWLLDEVWSSYINTTSTHDSTTNHNTGNHNADNHDTGIGDGQWNVDCNRVGDQGDTRQRYDYEVPFWYPWRRVIVQPS